MLKRLNDSIDFIMNEFYPIGSLDDSVGVTRLGYTEVEDEMHDKFLEMAKNFGLNTYIDEVGNSFAYIGDFEKYHLIGSHLDSVVDGGRYDGVAGVAV
jgi:acetylornithine deacetylase/succinyl-diaminopimelate desuccinylase-like protein